VFKRDTGFSKKRVEKCEKSKVLIEGVGERVNAENRNADERDFREAADFRKILGDIRYLPED